MAYPIYRAFISSTFTDLGTERAAVATAIQDVNSFMSYLGVCVIPVDLVRGAAPRPPLPVCLEELRNSDIVLTVVADRYGTILPEGQSFTEAEFDEAKKTGKIRLAYLKSEEALVLPEYVDRDPNHVRALQAFKEKIDLGLKREVFTSPENLRGHVVRDLTRCLLTIPQVISAATSKAAKAQTQLLDDIFRALSEGDYPRAARLITTERAIKDMRRWGMKRLWQAILADILELGSMVPPTRIVAERHRGELLLEYFGEYGDSVLARAALEEAQNLEEQIGDPSFSFSLLRGRVEISIDGGCSEHALEALKVCLTLGGRSGDLHWRAQACILAGKWYAHQQLHGKAVRWFMRAIQHLCKMREICPFCLFNAFFHAGNEHLLNGQCDLGNDRLMKALMIARRVRDRRREASALRSLGRHFSIHGRLRESVVCFVLAARATKEADPTDESSDVGALLSFLIAKLGHDRIRNVFNDVQSHADELLGRIIREFNVGEFVDELGLSADDLGDHW